MPYFNIHQFTKEPTAPALKTKYVSGLTEDASDSLYAKLGQVRDFIEFDLLVFVEPSPSASAEKGFELATREDMLSVASVDHDTLQLGAETVGVWVRKDGAILTGNGRIVKVVYGVKLAVVV